MQDYCDIHSDCQSSALFAESSINSEPHMSDEDFNDSSIAHKPALIILIALTVITFTVFLIAPAFFKRGPNGGFFENGEVKSDISPAFWVFGVVWSTIFIYQIIWLVYGITTIFRKSDGGFLYYAPPYMPPQLYIFFSLACLSLTVWYYFATSRSTVGRSVSCALLYACTFMLYLAMYYTFKSLDKYKDDLSKEGKDVEVRLVTGMVLNGLGEFAAWGSLASLVNLNVVLINDTRLNVRLAGTITLLCVAFDVILWVILDNFVFHAYTQYLFTPYPVVLIALIGIITRNWDPENRNSIISVGLLICIILATTLKLTRMIIVR